MQVLLIQVDGKLPNLALMKLAHWHRSQGHTVTLIRRRRRDLFDPYYDKVYASAIFSDSEKFFPPNLKRLAQRDLRRHRNH